jgi:prepilin peptidase CpaA
MYEALPLALCACLLIVAACCDVATMQIPNWVSIALAGAFPLAALLSGFEPLAIGLHLGFGLAVLMACFLLFQIGILGGGDAKLIAAAAVWTGLGAFGQFALWTTLAGGLLALSLLIARRAAQPAETRPAYLNRLLKPRGGMPYGVAIAFGAIAALNIDAIASNASALTTP